jgi:hypothetical protein
MILKLLNNAVVVSSSYEALSNSDFSADAFDLMYQDNYL